MGINDDEHSRLINQVAQNQPYEFKVKESFGHAHKDENYYPETILAGSHTFELTEARIYRSNSWAVYRRKMMEFSLSK
jgi:hypothetical protein